MNPCQGIVLDDIFSSNHVDFFKDISLNNLHPLYRGIIPRIFGIKISVENFQHICGCFKRTLL